MSQPIKPAGTQASIRRGLAPLLSLLLLTGCAATKEAVLPQDGPTMAAIYDAHFTAMGQGEPLVLREGLGHRPVEDGGEGSLAGYTHQAFDEIAARLPRQPSFTDLLP